MIRAMLRPLRRAIAIGNHPLNRKSRLTAPVRYARWKMRQRLSGKPVTVPYVGDAVLVWPKESGSVRLCAKFGLGEPHDMAFLLRMLRAGDLFADVGANAGVYTVLASKVIGARSVAMEPVPKTFALLARNIAANGIEALVDARQTGVGRGPDRLRFTASAWSFGHVVEGAEEDSVDVAVDGLDDILAGRVPCLIKVDVEGYEGEVVRGARRTLADPRCKAVILELAEDVERYGTTGTEIGARMIEYGFRPFWYDELARTLAPAGRSRPGRWNKIFIRDMDFVDARLASAPALMVRGVSL